MSKETIAAELFSTESKISVEAMAIMVDALKHHAASKGRQFNCVVLDRAQMPDDDELIGFLTQLKQNLSFLPNNRIQVLYRSNEHWSTFDLEIKNGQLSFFLLDAANSLPHVLSAMATIHTIFPRAGITYSGPGFQKDGHNCGFFSLDHAFNLSKISTLHEQLPACVEHGPLGPYANYAEFAEAMIGSTKSLNELPNQAAVISAAKALHYIPMKNIPKNFGSLIKTTQNLDDYERFFANKGYERHNKKSLDDYVHRKITTHTVDSYNPPIRHNKAINDKRDYFKQLGLAHLQTLNETYVSILNSRKLINKATNIDHRQSPEFNKYLAKLRSSIVKMKEHGGEIANEDPIKGKIVTDLANQLEFKVNQYFANPGSNSLKDINPGFKTEFDELLHSQDGLMAEHRKYWKVIIANIALSFTVIGVFIIAGNSIASQKLTLFFEKTQSENDIIDINVEFNNLAAAAG